MSRTAARAPRGRRGKGVRWVVLAGALALCVGAPSGSLAAADPYRPTELTKMQEMAEAARGLQFKQPPLYQRLRYEELAPFLRKTMLEGLDERRLNEKRLAYEKLGLLTSAEGLLDDMILAYANGVVAFYDQDSDTVHLIGDLKMPAVMQRIAELHELVHALQDQHFDLDALPLKGALSDPATAALALVEGDAMLATIEYARGHTQLVLSDLLGTTTGSSTKGPAMPYLFQREMDFVYRNGFDFAKALHKRGGWAALGEAFAAPPTSTEQVLHYREKYIEARDEPTPVELPDLSARLGEHWRLAADDVLGELYIQTLFRLHLGRLRARKPSRGWDGDRLHFYLLDEAPAGGESAAAYILVWSTVWDSERDAGEFAAASLRVVGKKLEGRRKTEQDGPVVTITGKNAVAFIVSEGTRVLSVEGHPESAARAALKALAPGAPQAGTGVDQETP
ncbi:MAG: hypothetical protein JW889_04765 [Verrucomicrobia bacterium]|nr:hypothetical protein [Verrucomicrobiota bacterium]